MKCDHSACRQHYVDTGYTNCVLTARFWVYENGSWCKLTLRPGQQLTHSTHETDLEGYQSSYTSWHHTGSEIARESGFEASDCDGPISGYQEATAQLHQLASHQPVINPADPCTPVWVFGDGHRRDHYAELAGY